MILQIDTENHWVEFKPAKGNMPDSFLTYSSVNLGQFHSEVILWSILEKETSTMRIKQHEKVQLPKI